MLSGLNHLTIAVTDVERALRFYVDLLGARPHARWEGGAYLTLGALWLCLSLDPARDKVQGADYTHYAFGIAASHFDAFAARLRAAGVVEWKQNRSEGDSLYFLDPDGHRLELHTGDLQSRLSACRSRPYAGMRFFDGEPSSR